MILKNGQPITAGELERADKVAFARMFAVNKVRNNAADAAFKTAADFADVLIDADRLPEFKRKIGICEILKWYLGETNASENILVEWYRSFVENELIAVSNKDIEISETGCRECIEMVSITIEIDRIFYIGEKTGEIEKISKVYKKIKGFLGEPITEENTRRLLIYGYNKCMDDIKAEETTREMA